MEKRIEALAEFTGFDTEDITKADWGKFIFEAGNQEYMVLTDTEAKDECKNTIESELWAFNADFIVNQCGLLDTCEVVDSLRKMQERCCEDCNDFIAALIEGTCGIDDFVREAVCADGRGHFIARYDGRENEQNGYFIYRIN